MKRFNKDKLIKDLWEIINKNISIMYTENNHHFDVTDGYSQVVGKGEGVNRAYQEIRTIIDIADLINSGSIGR